MKSELALPGVWVIPAQDGLPRCACCIFWREPPVNGMVPQGRIGVFCGPAVEMGEWDGESSETAAIVAAWRRLLARDGVEAT